MFWLICGLGLLLMALGVLLIIFRVPINNAANRLSRAMYGRFAFEPPPDLLILSGGFTAFVGFIFFVGSFSLL